MEVSILRFSTAVKCGVELHMLFLFGRVRRIIIQLMINPAMMHKLQLFAYCQMLSIDIILFFFAPPSFLRLVPWLLPCSADLVQKVHRISFPTNKLLLSSLHSRHLQSFHFKIMTYELLAVFLFHPLPHIPNAYRS